jgi:hypothetical protein
MFDTTSELVIQARTGKAKVDISMRWPTDEEWGERHRTRKIQIRNLGRGITETDVDTADADLKLYRSVRLNGAPELTAAEASMVVKTIERADVSGVVIDGEEAAVTMQVLGGTVTHRLQLPTADQVIKMQRGASRMFSSSQRNASTVRMYLEPTAKLWDECQGRGEGYAGAVPSLHKDAAIRAVVEQISIEMSPSDDEAFF